MNSEQVMGIVTNLPETIADAGKKLRDGSFTSEALVEGYLACIKKLEPSLHAFISITENEAREAAAALDAELNKGTDRGPLHGIPIVYKDNFDTAGVPTTLGSALYRTRVPQKDATVVSRLKAAGTVMLGKTSLPEFASNTSGGNPFFGDVRNPWDIMRSSGGSSSGTAAAVASGMCMGGVGSDTGGSIRIPASWCGITGIRPTFGLVSLCGVYPRAYSLDCAGPMARTAADCAYLLNAMAGYDPNYRYSIHAAPQDYTADLTKGIKGLRLGFIESYRFCNIDKEVTDAIQTAANRFAALGAEVTTVDISLLDGALDYSSLFDFALYEFNQVLGDRYRATDNKDEVFGQIVRANLAKGERISKEVYEKILDERPRQIAKVKQTFSKVDALFMPTLPAVAVPRTANSQVYEQGRRFNIPVSFLGLPSLSMLCEFSPGGLPVGLLLIGDELEEALLLRIAATYEKATGLRKRRPPITCGTTMQ